VITVRRAIDADRAAIARLHEASVRQLAKPHYTAKQINSWIGALQPERYPLDTTFFVVALDGETVVGFGEYLDGSVNAVYVHPSHARRGVGRMLFDALEAEALANGATSLSVTSSLNAVPFYEACGFIRDDESTFTTRGGAAIPCWHLTKMLR
jgi:putative acetyltransferase